ncbi:Pyridoxal-phosphate dependent enzyme [Neofusicoccum parvum]|uniref:Pyridoxal-phosphate dependent enzyme n=1 Tax=Neofusicoccum parvum TaxID=310453 RepID=A0ACB5SG51_9PEZI|nr:Pyridoxal-phosphate dependent enzyme [Neofusicoccum parvum]GME52767.1 Pyridoxal-phosphate dependent enzyme [Neofusicoccum parvum]
MVKVAVAGGLGHVGKTIVDVLKNDPKHHVVVLSRKAPENPTVPVLTVDYDSVDSLKEVLESNQIHAVISTLMIMDETAGKAQINLIKAAAKSAPTTKFVASEWGVPFGPEQVAVLPHYQWWLNAVDELKKTDLQWTRFANGYFLDYWGLPHLKSYQEPFMPVLDIANKFAGIPGDGNTPVTFTYTFDLAKFVVASLDLPEWPEYSIVVGDKLTWNEFVKLAEEARGTKFEIHYDDLQKLKKGEVTELPHHPPVYQFFPKERLQGMFAFFGYNMATGLFNLPTEDSLNKKFPEIKTLTAKDVLEQVWKGK